MLCSGTSPQHQVSQNFLYIERRPKACLFLYVDVESNIILYIRSLYATLKFILKIMSFTFADIFYFTLRVQLSCIGNKYPKRKSDSFSYECFLSYLFKVIFKKTQSECLYFFTQLFFTEKYKSEHKKITTAVSYCHTARTRTFARPSTILFVSRTYN